MDLRRVARRLLSNWKGNRRAFVLQAELCNHCNFHCRFCPHSVYRQPSASGNRFDREKGYMAERLFGMFLRCAEEYAKTVVIGFFGEPMLHPDFDRFIEAIPERRGYRVILNTNFSLVTRKNMDVLRRFDCVRISIDSSSASIYEMLCPGGPVLDLEGRPSKGRFPALVEKIDYWLNLAQHPLTQLVYVASSVNKEDEPVFLDYWLPRMGRRDSALVKNVISYGGVMSDSRMFPGACEVPEQKRITVAWNGDCSPCNLDVNLALRIGNMYEEDLATLLASERYHEILASMRDKQGICSNCFDANNHARNSTNWGQRR